MSIELTLLSRVAYRGQEIAGQRLRSLVALLAGDLRTGCGSARLVARLWPDEQPAKPTKALQVLVSRARTQLGSELIASTPTGYRLTLSENQVDASAILLSASSAARHAGAGDHAAALAVADEGLGLWDGPAATDAVLDDPVSALRAERRLAYRSLVRVRALSLARLGRRTEAVDPLTELAAERPRDEEVLAELLRCEAATAGPTTALARYETYRRELRDELGADPGSALRATYQQLLRSTAPTVRQGIPHEPNPLLGRERDVAAVSDLLRSHRVTSIVGTGGLGKTRLAQAVARNAEHQVVHLIQLASLAAESDRSEVAAEVASTIAAGDGWGPAARHATPFDPLSGIVRTLGTGSALLVLDNCEHVVEGVADLVGALVSTTQDVQVLTTSRAPLGLSSEAVYPLPELNLATAAELFELRARAVRPDVELPAHEVRELCGRLDGLPLAVELAAARVRTMSVPEITWGLADRFGLLRGGPRDAPERHHTLYAVVDWSWHLLDPAAQAAIRALSIFPDGFTADTARQVLDASDVHQVLERLVDQSLLDAVDTDFGTRFRMLETVREFGADKRERAQETGATLEHFLAWARDFGAACHEGVFDPPTMRRAREEQDNLVQALRLGLDRSDGATVAATFAVLGWLWFAEAKYSRVAQISAKAARVLSHFRPEPDLVEVTRSAAAACAASAVLQGPMELRSLAVLRRLPPAPPTNPTRALAILLVAMPDFAGSDPAALDRLCDSAEPLLAGFANGAATYVREQAGDQAGALAAAERMLAAFEREPSPWLLFQAHSRVGELALLLEEGEKAKRHMELTLRLAQEVMPTPRVEDIWVGATVANLQCGDLDEAEHWFAKVSGKDESFGAASFLLCVRAQLLLARGYVDEGLRVLRQAVDSWCSEPISDSQPRLDGWILGTDAVTVAAHAQHDRLDLVSDSVNSLPGRLVELLEQPVEQPVSYGPEHQFCGSGLFALGMVELARASDVRMGIRLVALADRFGYVRAFHPTMASARARRTAAAADKSAYAEAVSSYADLDRRQLRAEALRLLRATS
ncbi:MAG: AfsR/SARP family transcriptional regulator [Pseudonocardiaceae bacterium]|nr:AfsR/SARP family transcriptional regulator [Pseudonocardiaceae bacterium]